MFLTIFTVKSNNLDHGTLLNCTFEVKIKQILKSPKQNKLKMYKKVSYKIDTYGWLKTIKKR